MGNLHKGCRQLFNRPLRGRTILFWTLGIVIFEGILFMLSYQAKYNPVNALNNFIPAAIAPAEPTFLAPLYGPVSNPLKKPMAVAVANRRIYVADTDNHRVFVFDYDANPLFGFGSNGTGEGQLRFPYGIAADSQGQVYVADLYNGNISVFSPDGAFLRYFGSKGDFIKPAGLAIDGDKLYLTDVAQSQVIVYSLEGQKLLTFGKPGKGDGELSSPNAVAHSAGKIFVSDTANDRIVVFDDQGNFITKFNGSTAGNKVSVLINPRGIGVDAKGTVYVVSNLTSKVHGFNEQGELLLSFGENGAGEAQFRLPNGLAVDDQGKIYVTDTGNARLQIFQN